MHGEEEDSGGGKSEERDGRGRDPTGIPSLTAEARGEDGEGDTEMKGAGGPPAVMTMSDEPSSEASRHKRALQYAREHLYKFQRTHQRDVGQLMGHCAFSLTSSPYLELRSDSVLWAKADASFTELCMRSMGLPRSDPLVTTLNAAAIVLPQAQEAAESLVEAPSPADPLPFEVEPGPEFIFHSAFVCPVAKEQTTRENPPMLLKCGHVISKAALGLMVSVSRNKLVKCPTCPMEHAESEAMEIKF
jgi:hypothetical protein